MIQLAERPSLRVLRNTLAASAIAWGIVQYGVSPTRTSFVLQPVHHDDYTNLSLRLPAPSPPPTRPVSRILITFFGETGALGYSLALQLLTIAYVSLVLLFVSRFLSRPVSFAAALCIAGIVFLHPRSLEWGRYTGLMTNLLAAVFGLLALLAFEENLERRRSWLPAAGGLLLLLSALSKEDFVLPALVFGIWGAVRRPSGLRSALANLAAAGAAAAALYIYNTRVEPNSFTQIRKTGAYAFASSPGELASTFLGYFTQYPLVWLSAVVCLLLAFAAALDRRVPPDRLLVLLLITASLVVPYAFLPNHVFPYYSMSWLCWLVAISGVVVSGAAAERGARRAWLLVGASVLVWIAAFWLTRRDREEVRRWYAENSHRTRRIEDSLRRNRPLLSAEKRIGILGTEWPNPWIMTDGSYLRRWLGLTNQWVVFAPANSPFFPANFPTPFGSTIEVERLADVVDSGPLLFFAFSESGAGTPIRHRDRASSEEVVADAKVFLESRPRSIARLYPSGTKAGHRFQKIPGASAIAVEGRGFSPDDRILWNGRPLVTTYGSPEVLTAVVPDELIARPGEAVISVQGARATFQISVP